MKLSIVILVIIILFAAIILNRKHFSKRSNVISIPTNRETKAIQFDSSPDLPIPFGYKNQWFAIKSVDAQAVIDALQLKDIQVSNWESGMEGASEGYYFVTPPVNGWILVINSLMPDISGQESPAPLESINELSSQFGEAYYFGTHRVVEYHAWAKSLNGKLIRAYGYIGESGETLVNQGEISKEERKNDLLFTDLESDEPNFPTEEDVLLMASKWTTDPLMGHGIYEKGTGFVGTLD